MKPETVFDVFGLGAVSIDFLGMIGSWPEQGVKVRLNDLKITGGGLVATALTTVARLGGKAAIAANLGTSFFAEQSMGALHDEGIDTNNVIRDHGDPVVSFILTDGNSGERNIFFSRNNVSYPSPEEFPDKMWYEKCRVLLIDHGTGNAGVKTARMAREKGIPVIIDAERAEPEISQLLDLSDHIIVGKRFAALYTDKEDERDMIRSLQTRDGQVVIITLGDRGLIGCDNGSYFTMSAIPVSVVDTTGCGDAFHGAYALGISRNWNIRKSSLFASGAAAMKAMKPGGRDGLPHHEELMKFMEQAGFDLRNS
ncbi:MAG TPA: PfkB family carbohydrate kinase [Cyclobacteriaceae bacterium]|nr:PfkB family carbohydrate kinase [Cyclobacteriaceae bacterium]